MGNQLKIIYENLKEKFSAQFSKKKIQEKTTNQIFFLFLQNVEIIANQYSKNMIILKKLLNFLAKAYKSCFHYKHCYKNELFRIKECIYQVALKISKGLLPSKNMIYEYQSDEFLIKQILITNRFKDYGKCCDFEIKFPKNQWKSPKNIRLKIKFPFSLIFNEENEEEKSFLFQTIIWKYDHSIKHKNIASYLFSFDIINKSTNEIITLKNLSKFYFKFSIPGVDSLHSLFKKEEYKCQFFNKSLKSWQSNGCKMQSIDFKNKHFGCSCNHLTEFRVTRRLEKEKEKKANVFI